MAAGNRRHVHHIVPELERAEATIARVRAECDAIGTPHICNAIDRIRAALDTPVL
ncbi:hypothetical protein [Streptomyces sp. NPDC102264]|uniref:hypothetical protein n=1 Tax=Streptomyces sp. NPDC102264 TaxID=3366149 RepID=UPI0038083076